MSSFNRLPSEIKHLIVKEVYLSDISCHVDEDVPMFFRKDNSFKPSDFKNGMAPKRELSLQLCMTQTGRSSANNLFWPHRFFDCRCMRTESSIASVALVDKQMHRICKVFLCRVSTTLRVIKQTSSLMMHDHTSGSRSMTKEYMKT